MGAGKVTRAVNAATWSVPAATHDPEAALFIPDEVLAQWARATFIEEGAVLLNTDHAHLRFANIGFLWTRAEAVRRGHQILGQAEIFQPRGSPWAKARQAAQVRSWFGAIPDFLITLDATYCAGAEPAAFCALVEHELYHCGQAVDAWGLPRFNKTTGLPAFCIRAHDVEEFVGVVERYGASAAGESALHLVEATRRGPTLAAATTQGVCGTCLARAA